MSKWFSSEVEMAAHVVSWLRSTGWDVYQEVTFKDDVADIVAVCGPILWVIECKTTMSLDLMAQAHSWVGLAHRVSIAVPSLRRKWKRAKFVGDALSYFGVGHLEVTRQGSVREVLAPALWRRVQTYPSLKSVLLEKQKTHALAGNADGKRWTPFQETCQNLRELVARCPGLSVDDAVRQISHHYSSRSSAKRSLIQWISAGKVGGVRLKKDGKFIRLYKSE